MLWFLNDYSEGAHEKILQRLMETNREPLPGYGDDRYCESAKAKIRALCGCPQADVEFLVGGTQTNKTVIGSLLRPYEGVISAPTGHISGHEAGAIEATGHKVLELPQVLGKLRADDLSAYLRDFYANETCEHMVRPGMVYISHPTEYGTLYTKAELAALHEVCKAYKLPLYMDGARLGYGLVSGGADLTLPDIARYLDVFYIGGTKVGALCGEAVVYPKGDAPAHFLSIKKRQGALLAKGRLLGVQFDTLFTDGLYFEISKSAVEKADALRAALRQKGYAFHVETPSNQIFIVLENARMAALREKVRFGIWEKVDEGHTAIRLVTSWATRPEDVQALIELL